jgi:hypothetical protein
MSSNAPASQPRLMVLLLAEIERADTLLAKTELSFADRQPIIQEVAALIVRIRKMEGQVQDPKAWQTIHTRANELDAALKGFSN